MRPYSLPQWLLVALLVLGFSRIADAKPPYYKDAPLNAVQFVKKDIGWAVGDDGVIWHTIDGGAHWERQSSGVRASLRSLHFLNPYFGWVVGREELSDGRSVGVVLQTSDGGVKWKRLLAGSLPGLNFVRFASPKVGYLAGDGADQYPTGVFVTENGGRNWKPISGPRCTSWHTGSFGTDGKGSLGGAWNRLASVQPDRVLAIDHDPLAGRNIRGMYFQGERGFAVGQGGLVLVSRKSQGTSWNFAEIPLERSALGSWDFHAIDGAGKQLWAVGRPGSAVLHSSDLGETWEVLQTGQPLPLNGVHFLDEQNGWAVGELGIILATQDGGKTWKIQQRGGQHAALLFLHARPKNVPLESIAHLGGQDGYLTTTLCMTSPDSNSASPKHSTDPQRLTTAMRRSTGAGGEMLWEFPLSQHLAQGTKEDLLKQWNQLHGGKAAEDMLRQLVLTLRVWRPNVIVTDNPNPDKTDNLVEALLVEAVREAAHHAADKNVFPEHFSVFGLEPWKPSKVYGLCEDRKLGHVHLDLSEISTELLATSKEYATEPMALLNTPGTLPPRVRSFRLLMGDEGALAHHHLMQGVQLASGGLARRAITDLEEPDRAILQAAKTTSQLSAMLEDKSALTDPNRLTSTIGSTIAKMPMEQGARAARLVASSLARAGHWEQAREVYTLLAERYPTHPVSVEAYRWLIQHNSSSEARRRHDLGQFVIARHRTYGTMTGDNKTIELGYRQQPGDKQETKPHKVSLPTTKTQKIEQITYIANNDERRRWSENCLDMGERLAVHGALFSRDPQMQFSLQSARRRLGKGDEATKWYGAFAARCSDGPWRDAAKSELWYANRHGAPTRPVSQCRRTETRPFLDGLLEDDCWKNAKPMLIQHVTANQKKQGIAPGSPKTNDYPTEVRMSYDKDFLYIALRCFHPAGMQLPKANPREHDADMRKYDRVSLMFDLDRDYSTYFHLQVDQRGCVLEDCWGDKGWDPQWFVAVRSEARVWVIEAAIPLVGMTGDNILPGQAWACNVIRVVPGKEIHAFSTPANVPEEGMHPEGMGLLLFTEDGKVPVQTPTVVPPRMPTAR